MIPVLINNIIFPNDWLQRAKNARDLLLTCPSQEERRKLINKHSVLWKTIKRQLEALSEGKCWYCESRQDRSDMAVDHFRPKGEVADCPGHEGYWWLSFDWENLRLSCTFCNSRRTDRDAGTTGGKQSYFPLTDETRRAKSPTDDYWTECPALLDPANPADPPLLWFIPTGEAVPRYDEEEPEAQNRAEISINLYHLNHTALTQRRAVIATRIQSLVQVCERHLARNPRQDASAREGVMNAQRDILDLINRKSEFSAFARAILRSHEDKAWVQEILQMA